jgi:hypothetical protein
MGLVGAPEWEQDLLASPARNWLARTHWVMERERHLFQSLALVLAAVVAPPGSWVQLD